MSALSALEFIYFTIMNNVGDCEKNRNQRSCRKIFKIESIRPVYNNFETNKFLAYTGVGKL